MVPEPASSLQTKESTDVSFYEREYHRTNTRIGHKRNFVRCIDDCSRPVTVIGKGHISSTLSRIANNAMRLGCTMDFDQATHTAIDDPEATALLKGIYREPYVHPAEI